MKALIVEDDRILSNNICESLKHKFDMTQAFDGEEGLERLARESFDVIILDVMMPRLNGYEVLEQMRGGGITTPVLMLTALGQASDQVKGLRAGRTTTCPSPLIWISFRPGWTHWCAAPGGMRALSAKVCAFWS